MISENQKKKSRYNDFIRYVEEKFCIFFRTVYFGSYISIDKKTSPYTRYMVTGVKNMRRTQGSP